ncbi:MAG TPA: SRPBCC family protein [Dehalococcoidia bacterium]|nr:SRPBCC family protein [Dehalococcoidia bacterium]
MNQQSTKLTVTLPSDLEIVMSRSFPAPRELVFEAHTKPEHIKRWWGPRAFDMPVCEMDFRPGGAWRYVHWADGEEYAFHGTYLEIEPPSLIKWTFEWEGMPGHVVTETMELAEQEGKTILTTTSLFPTREDRDGMLQTGMEGGASESYDRLAELLVELSS